jgi:sigma-B regulation protein RsbU (phosphoserine phosphatase)
MKTEILMAERKQSEQALVESELRYRRLLSATTDYVYSVELDAGPSGATSHGPGCLAVTGYTSAEFTADPYLWYRVIHEEDRAAVLAHVERILAGAAPGPLEHRLVHKTGGVRWIRNVPIPHRNDQGRLIAYDGLISDITSRKRGNVGRDGVCGGARSTGCKQSRGSHAEVAGPPVPDPALASRRLLAARGRPMATRK